MLSRKIAKLPAPKFYSSLLVNVEADMSIRRIRLVIPVWVAVVLVGSSLPVVTAQNGNSSKQGYNQFRPRPTQNSQNGGNANQNRQGMSQQKGMSNQGQKTTGQAKPQATSSAKSGANNSNNASNAKATQSSKANAKIPAASAVKVATAPEKTSIEKLDPAKRAEFLKLIGANWIWSPAYKKDDVPVGDVYFRKSFELNQSDFGQVHIACDNQYELYVNGRLVGKGGDWRKMDVHDVQQYLVHGSNIVAIKATNTDAGAAGLVARVIVKEKGGTYESYSTDATWKTSVKPNADWAQARLKDGDWLAATVYGPLGGVLPWGDEIVIADEGSRFVTEPEFVVERLVTDEQAGSLITMAFNAAGDILASREGGGLELIRDKDKDGKFESVEPFCDEVKNIQGILSLGNRVYAVGDGPDGGALYQITDADNDGKGEKVVPLVKYRGVIGEHGPHTVRLGPDGLLYVLSGNFSQIATTIDARSPYVTTYEGDLVLPKYEDPKGHAVGVPAPGGSIIRTDTNASFVEMFSGGFRNPYDFAFNGDGELFTYDADMEWDMGAPWYRPTRLVHVAAGGEYGWRSGWSKFPAYYLDSLPATADIGAGSPTGVVYYNHTAYPARLQNTMFMADWALGEIHALKLERDGASYKAKVSTFLKGRPLNVTALDVGPDGALYFSTGGRGTDGGIYRVKWTGTQQPQNIAFGQGIQQALDQPQLHSDWARAKVAAVRRSLGDRWQTELERILTEERSTAKDKLRAIELLTYFGPTPTPALLTTLANDKDPAMRARAARLIGIRTEAELGAPLVALLGDSDAWVRRVACEAVAHRGTEANVPALVGLLADKDRFVAFAARRALEKLPAKDWQDQVLAAENPRQFVYGATGLLVQYPSQEVAQKILVRSEALMRGEVNEPGMKAGEMSDANFLDLLRVVQLALVRGKVAATEVPSLTQRVLSEYPTGDATMNRELVKLLAYLQPPGAAHAMAHQLETDAPALEKLHVAAYVPRVNSGWETPDKLIMLRYLETVRGVEGGHSLSGYIEYFARDFFVKLTMPERRQVIAAGENYPTSSLSILARLPENPGGEVLAEIRALDQRIKDKPGEPMARLRVGVVAVLAQSGEDESLKYLRELYRTDPERRAPVAMSLTQHPEGDNWAILVDSLRTVDGEPAQEIVSALTKVNRQPETSEPYRNTILLGLRLQTNGGENVAKLLEQWVGQVPYKADAPLEEKLAAWQHWYATTFPNERPAELPKESAPNKWSYEELLAYLDSAPGKTGSASRGATVFKDGQCISCHRFNGKGESIGPDLTTVAQRFQRKEILESIVYPNQVVSDQYASKTVTAGGIAHTGIVAKDADGNLTVLQSDGRKFEVKAGEVEDVQPSKVSAMPEGLANRLTLEQLGDLFAYLTGAPEPNIAGRDTGKVR
jgi:putative heme-binding domain-containing protein